MLTFPPDISFVVQIVSFLVLWAGLKRLVFDPMMRVLEEREQRTTGARHAAAELRAATESSAAGYEHQLQTARAALAGEAEQTRLATETEERQVLTAARNQASAQLAQLRERLGRQADDARPALAAEARALATQMLDRVVGRGVA